ANPIAEALAELGHAPGDSPLRSLDDLLAREPSVADKLVAALAPRVARLKKADAAAAMLGLGAALAALGDLKLARENLVEAAALVADAESELAARIGVKLGALELAAGNRGGAKLQAARAFSSVVATGDAALLGELGKLLDGAGEALAAQAVEQLRRREGEGSSSGGGVDRTATLARVIAALNSCAAGTAEPLFEILRA